ncbi:hypothetical protein OGAPHI_004152 [Ogataea philodendri]|uniref:ER lumen protein-retaining receptor n=1 Tax=Ogataea philodendri TaxID=1378263 RepID=A0A9P8P522_9ASCO|nr:uncharacterized protein OGAPHI_004152 [Ogataea philodendri]KAH3665963.1 hypothetical protein OGAPHI_004152 [Ogataea philodendri]
MLNIFRIAGDLSHLVSIFILINTINVKKSAQGISLKTNILYAVVFVTRYVDLLYSYTSLYNTLMKIFFISSSIYTIVMLKKYSKNIQQYNDDFKIEYLIAPSFVLGLIFNHGFKFSEILWSFSLWLESVSILPQLFMLQKSGESQLLTTHYIFALGLYRALYIPNWIYRYFAEGRFDKLAITTGIIQTLVYSDFFYVYYQKVIKNIGFSLPQ